MKITKLNIKLKMGKKLGKLLNFDDETTNR